ADRIAASVAGKVRAPDLAAVASERHILLAPHTGDQLRIVISAYHRAAHSIGLGDYDTARRVLERARQHLDDSPSGRALAIQLNLRSAVLCARAADAAAADEYIAEARAIAAQFDPPDRPYFNIDASMLNIDVHWCAAPVENYDAAEAVRRGGQVHLSDPSRPERIGHHHIDQARAWMLQGDRERALQELNAARETAPRSTRHHPSVKETILAMAEHDRRATDSLSGFARWVGIEL
ncbi:MAG TPA: hypothetical protein VHC49_20030, partial [Mycobacteriales bacterium]|nr:hypothetical protein [Mycobacteriales bacterium]